MAGMTPKDRRDAQLELRDMALELEHGQFPNIDDWDDSRSQRWDRAKLLRAVAAELDKVTHE